MTRERLTPERINAANAVTLRAAYRALLQEVQEAVDALIRIDDLHNLSDRRDTVGVCGECQDAWPCETSRIADEVLA